MMLEDIMNANNVYYGLRCYNKESQPIGWLYTYDSDTELVWTDKNLDWCKRWKTERGAEKNIDRYNSRWQFKSKGGYLQVELMPEIFESESQKKAYQFLDVDLEEKYESMKRIDILQQHDRIKLPILAHDIYVNPNYTTIDAGWLSTWDLVKQSRFIESLIVNIPVPPIILYEESYGKYKIIDGRERLRAIADFYNRRLVLTGLELEPELDGRTYATLSTAVQSKLDLRSLYITTILPGSSLSPDRAAQLIETISARLGKS